MSGTPGSRTRVGRSRISGSFCQFSTLRQYQRNGCVKGARRHLHCVDSAIESTVCGPRPGCDDQDDSCKPIGRSRCRIVVRILSVHTGMSRCIRAVWNGLKLAAGGNSDNTSQARNIASGVSAVPSSPASEDGMSLAPSVQSNSALANEAPNKTRRIASVVPTASWSTTILPMTKSCSDETAALRGGFNRSPHEPIWQLSAYCVCSEKQGLREAAIHFGYNISPLA